MMQTSQVSVKKATAFSPISRTMPWHVIQIPIPPPPPPGPGKEKTCLCDPLIKPNQDITPDPGREVHLGLEVELDAHRERGVLEVAVGVDGSLEKFS